MAETINNPDTDALASKKILGDDKLVFISDGATPPVFSPIVCLTTNSMTKSRDTIDAATKCGADSRPGKPTFQLSFEGETIDNAPTTAVSELEIDWLLKNKVSREFLIQKAIPAIGDSRDRFTGFITQDNTADAMNTMETFSVQVAIQGTPIKEVYDGTAWTEYVSPNA